MYPKASVLSTPHYTTAWIARHRSSTWSSMSDFQIANNFQTRSTDHVHQCKCKFNSIFTRSVSFLNLMHDGIPWWSPSQVLATILCVCALLCLVLIIAAHLGNKVIFYQLSPQTLLVTANSCNVAQTILSPSKSLSQPETVLKDVELSQTTLILH